MASFYNRYLTGLNKTNLKIYLILAFVIFVHFKFQAIPDVLQWSTNKGDRHGEHIEYRILNKNPNDKTNKTKSVDMIIPASKTSKFIFKDGMVLEKDVDLGIN